MGKNLDHAVQAKNQIDECLRLQDACSEAKKAHEAAVSAYRAKCKEVFGFEDFGDRSLAQIGAMIWAIAHGAK